MVVDCRLFSLSILTADQPSRIYREWSKEETASSEGQLNGGTYLLGVKGQKRSGTTLGDCTKQTVSNTSNLEAQAKAAEDHIGYHITQLRTTMGDHTNSHWRTIMGPCLTILWSNCATKFESCWLRIWCKDFEGMDLSSLASTVRACCADPIALGTLLRQTLVPLVPNEHHLNVTVKHTVVAHSVYPTLCNSFDGRVLQHYALCHT